MELQLHEALPHLGGIALFDRLPGGLPDTGQVKCLMWEQREIENYLCTQKTLEAYAVESARNDAQGPLFVEAETEKHLDAMRAAIQEIVAAMEKLGRGSPWDADAKVSDDFLDPLFRTYFRKLGRPNLMAKKNFCQLAEFIPKDEIADEVRSKLDAIVQIASTARTGGT